MLSVSSLLSVLSLIIVSLGRCVVAVVAKPLSLQYLTRLTPTRKTAGVEAVTRKRQELSIKESGRGRRDKEKVREATEQRKERKNVLFL